MNMTDINEIMRQQIALDNLRDDVENKFQELDFREPLIDLFKIVAVFAFTEGKKHGEKTWEKKCLH